MFSQDIIDYVTRWFPKILNIHCYVTIFIRDVETLNFINYPGNLQLETLTNPGEQKQGVYETRDCNLRTEKF